MRESWAVAERTLRALCRQLGATRAERLFRRATRGPIEAAAARARGDSVW